MEPRQFIRAAVAASVVGHLVLTLGFILADARPFEQVASQAITVDIVAPEDVPTPAKEAAQEPQKQPPPKQPDPFRLPEMKPTEQKQQATSRPAAQQSSQQTPQQQSSQQQASQQQASQQQASQQAAQPAGAPPASQKPPDAKQAAAQQPTSPQPQPSQSAPAAQEPDITAKYGVLLGLPNGDGGATAFAKADIAPVDTAAFRRHLKTCSALPGSVAPTDKVRIVLRAFLQPNGQLVGPPSLIEASASAKGPALMQAAIKALLACQPYAMLPADKYNEWKVLDLSFTPQDF